MTPSEAAKQAKNGTFDFGAPWNKITSNALQAVNLVCRPFNLESMVKRKTRLRVIYLCNFVKTESGVGRNFEKFHKI